MKRILINFLVVLAAFTFASCEKGDSEKDLGFPVIYIPQATVTGLDNSYPVPAGPLDQLTTRNCSIENGKLNIILGVARAGFISDKKGFSVSLGECPAETERKLAGYQENGTPAMALPAGTYSIPAKIEVPAGESGATSFVTVDLGSLASHREDIFTADGSKLLVLGLEISNPTAYELAATNTSVVLVIDPASAHWGDKPLI